MAIDRPPSLKRPRPGRLLPALAVSIVLHITLLLGQGKPTVQMVHTPLAVTFRALPSKENGSEDQLAAQHYSPTPMNLEHGTEATQDSQAVEPPRRPWGIPATKAHLETPIDFYDPEIQRRSQPGVLVFDVHVSIDGTAKKIIVASESSAVFTNAPVPLVELLIAKLKNSRFQPATLNGNPIDSTLQLKLIIEDE